MKTEGLPLFDQVFAGKPNPEPPRKFEGDEGLARNTDPPTAKLAGMGMDATRMEEVVVAALQQHGPMTTEQLADKTGQSLVSISPRLRPLEKKCRVQDSGRKARNRSGRNAIVWELL